MNVILLYAASVLIWGTTWIAISFQLGDVSAEVSLVYRFGLASLIMFVICKVSGQSLKFNLRQHLRVLGIAATMFSFNFYLIYHGQQALNSAMAAISFATLVIMNTLNSRLFFKTKVSTKAWVGSIIGLAGICTLFWPQVQATEVSYQSILGLGLCLAGTFVASISNMLSISNQQHNMPIMSTNAWGMGYGALIMAVMALANGREFIVDLPLDYWLATGYLALFGSVIAFACYLSLLVKIGASKTSYITVLTPVIAVIVSSLFEDFHWTVYTVSGIGLILLGNLVLLTKFKPKAAKITLSQAEPEIA